MARRVPNPDADHDELHEFHLALRNLSRALSRVRGFFREDRDELMAYYPALAESALAMDTRSPPRARATDRVSDPVPESMASGPVDGGTPESAAMSEDPASPSPIAESRSASGMMG